MPMARRLCRAHGVRVHVTCNTMPRNQELDALPEYLEYLQDIGADALIVGDAGVLALAKRYAPRVSVHMSTQIGVTNYAAAAFWYDQGAQRVILARELTLDEVAGICARRPRGLEVEAFIHGAMCVSFSGRCVLSNGMPPGGPVPSPAATSTLLWRNSVPASIFRSLRATRARTSSIPRICA